MTDRGVEKREIFIEVDDYRKFVFYLGRAAKHFNLLIHGFCLIPNHYHVECETPNANLSRAMQWLNTSYAVYFNRRYQRVGHVFQGRYYSTLVQKEKHLLELTRYIHLNPVRAGLVKLPQEYEWSSYRCFIGGAKRFNWLETDWTLSQFANTRLKARDAYRSFVEEGLETKLADPLELAVDGILGDDLFLNALREKFKKDELLDRERINRRRSFRTVPVGKIIEAVSIVCSAEPDQIRRKGGHRNVARDVALYLAHAYSGLTNAEVGAEFGGMRGSNISNICRKTDSRLKTDRELARAICDARKYLLRDG